MADIYIIVENDGRNPALDGNMELIFTGQPNAGSSFNTTSGPDELGSTDDGFGGWNTSTIYDSKEMVPLKTILLNGKDTFPNLVLYVRKVDVDAGFSARGKRMISVEKFLEEASDDGIAKHTAGGVTRYYTKYKATSE